MNDYNMSYNLSDSRYKSVCLVELESDTMKQSATGWLCSYDGWIITTGHMFQKDDSEIKIENTRTATDESREIFVTFPNLERMTADLLYVEKNNLEGIDFAVLRVEEVHEKILPLAVNITPEYWEGTVSILGIETGDDYAKPAGGYAEGGMINIRNGEELFQGIVCENAVREGYSGAPVFFIDADAVIGIQSMASKPLCLNENVEISPADRRNVWAMPIWKMVSRFPELKKHLVIMRRPFSKKNLIALLRIYIQKRYSGNASFSEGTIDETILPSVTEGEEQRNEGKDLNQPVLEAIRNSADRNCFIWGEEGGCGKTMVLRKMFFSILRTNFVRDIPIYIELREVVTEYSAYINPGMMFADYLALKLYDGEDRTDKLREKLFAELDAPSVDGTRYVLLLDGLNEVSIDRRQEICEEILFWAAKPHIRVIVTSRYKEERLVHENSYGEATGSFEEFFQQDRELQNMKAYEDQKDYFLFLTIRKLKENVIKEYLKNCGITQNAIRQIFLKKELLQILKIPMYLTIFARLYEEKQSSRGLKKEQLTEICTRGELLYFFFGESRRRIRKPVISQLEKLERQNEKVFRNKEFIFDKIIPYIAFSMAVKQSYSIERKDLIELLESLLNDENSIMQKRAIRREEYRSIYELANDQRALSINGEIDFRYKPEERIIRFIDEELHIMRKTVSGRREMEQVAVYGVRTNYEFLHENLRDFFAACWLQEDVGCFVISLKAEDLSLASRTIPLTVLEFLGDICHEHESTPYRIDEKKCWGFLYKSYIANVLGMLRGRYDETAAVAVSNIIQVMKYSRKGDLSGVDFSNINLTETWLGGIRFSRAYGDTYFTANFNGAMLNATNLIREGHDSFVSCVIQDRNDSNFLYSADIAGFILKWNCSNKKSIVICNLGSPIRDMIKADKNTLFVITEHEIYQINEKLQTKEQIYFTKAFLCNLKLVDGHPWFRTDLNPAEWIELKYDETARLWKKQRDEATINFWPASHCYEFENGKRLITGGSNKTHRVQVFVRDEYGGWNHIPVQTVAVAYGNHMNRIEVDRDETRVLFCIQNNLYEYSLFNGYLDTEKFALQEKEEILFASYLYGEDGKRNGFVYSSGSRIILMDNHYNKKIQLNSGNGVCHFVDPFRVDITYRFTRENSVQGDATEKYLVHTAHEIQEFDADSNICDRIFKKKGSAKLGYYLSDQKLRLFSRNLHSLRLDNFELETTRDDPYQFLNYNEMKGSASFTSQRLGSELTIYDRYTGEHESFKVYEGLMIQRCPMIDIKGDIAKPEYQAILRRYGAIIE